MSLRFIVGRAGTGKTHLCLDELLENMHRDPLGKPLFLIVPEQATFQMEQAVLDRPGIQGFARLHIVSFRRLARMVCNDLGGMTRPQIDEAGRRMLLRSLLHRRRDRLSLFGRDSLPTGLVDRVANTLAELRTHGLGPDDVRVMAADMSEAGSPVLQRKLQDLALLYEDYMECIAPGYTDMDGFLSDAATNMPQMTWLQGVDVWVDGFAAFTPMEYRMLSALIRVAGRVSVSLCLDAASISNPLGAEASLFHRPLEAYRLLSELAHRAGVDLEPDRILDDPSPGRFRTSSLLAHIEHGWDQPAPQPWNQPCNPEQLMLRVARNRTEEVTAVAAEILHLCRTKGYRFRDIAVIVRDLDTYHDSIAEIFSDRGIPYFLDQRRPVTFHPLARALLAGLKAVLNRYETQTTMRFLKSDLAPISRDEVDRLENYALKHGISGSAWWDERYWSSHGAQPENDERLELAAIRRRALMPLKRLGSALRNGDKPLERQKAAQILWAFLVDLDASRALAEWIAQAESQGDTEAVSVHQQVWEGVVTLLEGLGSILPEESVDLQELLAMIDEGFQSLRLGLIPPSLDQVLVGAVDRSRQPNVRAVFLLGAVDRQFPQVPREDMVFSDPEREKLKAAGYTLAATSRRRLQHERYLAYIAVTRASDVLWVSYPTADNNGRALFPSMLIGRLRQLVPAAKLEPVGEGASNRLAGIVTRRHLVSRMAAALRERPDDPFWLDVYEWVTTHPRLRALSGPLLRSLTYSNAVDPLPPDVATALYGEVLRTSVTRLERFAACSFQHFAADGLRLQERQEKRLDAGRLGMVSHEVLRTLFTEIEQAGMSWAKLTPETAVAHVDRIVDEILAMLKATGHVVTGRDRYLIESSRRTLQVVAQVLVEQMQAGRFRPAAVEAGFGRAGDDMPAWQPPSFEAHRLELRGVIDRIDRAEIDETTYVRIVDYKSRQRNLDLADVLHGIELQLLIYLAVATSDGSRPAGAFYMPVMRPTVQSTTGLAPDKLWQEQKKQLRSRGVLVARSAIAEAMDGSVGPSQTSEFFPFGFRKDGSFRARPRVVEAEDLSALLRLAERRVVQMATQIQAGEHAARPFRRANATRPCEYCPYHAVCRFDVLIPGSEYRVLPAMREDALWQQIRSEGSSASEADSASQTAGSQSTGSVSSGEGEK